MPYRTYLRAVNEKFGFLATWLPGQKLSVGDIGTVEKGVFRHESSLAALGFDLKVERSDVGVDLDHSSGSRIDFTVGGSASAQAAPSTGLGAEARIQFSMAGGFVLRAVGCVEHYFASRFALKSAILAARSKSQWHDEWVAIDSLHMAKRLTVMVCTSKSGGMSLAATAKADAGPFDIANTDLGVQVSAWEGDITRIVAGKAIAPLYSATRFRSGVFRGDRVEVASLQLRAAEGGDQVVPVTLQDALDED